MESKHPEDIDFQKYWQILKRHKAPAITVFLSTFVVAIIMALSSEEEYVAYGKLRFIKENTTSALIAEKGEKLGRLDTFKSTATPVDTEAQVIKSVPVVEEVIEQLNLTTEDGDLIHYEDFLKNLGVKNIPGTDILTITYQSPEEAEAERVVNKIVKVYLDRNIDIHRTQAKAAKEFINQQLPKTEAELYSAETKLRVFKEQNNIVNLDIETELAANKIGLIDEQIDSLERELKKVNTQIREIEHKLKITSQEAISLDTINDSSAIQQILTKLKDVEDTLAIERSRFKEGSPVIINLKDKKTELEKELQQRTQKSLNQEQLTSRRIFQMGEIQKQLAQTLVNSEVQHQSLTKELKSLRDLKNTSQQRNNLIPQLQQEYQVLLRKTEVSQIAYKNLLRSLQQIQIAENQNIGNVQIVNLAIVSQSSVSTSKKSILAAGLAVGSFMGVIIAFLLELRNSTFKTSKELRQSLNYKLLTTIPNLEKKDLLGRIRPMAILPELYTIEAPRSFVSEAYRMLYTNLEFLINNQDVQAITITSSIPKEGKSTVSANLASTVSQLGKKVLLIDGDLHKPRQHLIWGLDNQLGLIDILQGKASLSEAVSPSITNSSLHILQAGSTQTDYLSLINRLRMTKLIALCREKYDLVIVDTPPVLLFSDTLAISKNTDGVVLVGRLGVTNPTTTKSAKELLEQSKQRILGVVVNGVDREPQNHYQYAKDYESLLPTKQTKLLSPSKRK